MSGKQGPQKTRLVAALEGGAQGPPAFAPLYLDLYLEPLRRHRLAEVYAELAEGDSSLRLSHSEEIEAQLEAFARACAVLAEQPAWLPTRLGSGREALETVKVTFPTGKCLRHTPRRREPEDLLAPYDASVPDVWDAGGLPEIEDLRREPVPSARELIEAGKTEFPSRALERFGESYLLTASLGSPLWHAYSRLGFLGMMVALRERPDVLEALCELSLRQSLAQAEALRHAGIPCIYVEECLSSADLISPEDYLKIAYPPTRDLIHGLKQLGLRVVYYYCGSPASRLEHLGALQADALAFEESKKGFVIDLGQIRAELGPQQLLYGNTSAVLLRDGSPERIAADVRRQWDAAGPRLVVSMGSPATPDTPPAKLDALARGAAELT